MNNRKKLTWFVIVILTIPVLYASSSLWKEENEVSAAEPREAVFNSSPIHYNTDKWAVVPQAGSAVNVDGVLSEPWWEDAARLGGFSTFFHNDPSSQQEEVKAAYDHQHLYLGISSKDEDQTLVNIEILLRPNGSEESYYHYPLVVQTVDPAFATNWGGERQTISQVSSNYDHSGEMITAEVAIPISSLGVDSVELGQEWQMNVIFIHEVNTFPATSWSPVRTSLLNDTGAARITVTSPLVEEGRLGSLYMGELPEGDPLDWQPEQVKYLYAGYNEKQFTFPASYFSGAPSISLEWRTPSGTWVDLGTQTLIDEGDRRTLSFSHPNPTKDGTYMLRVQLQESGSAEQGGFILSFDRTDLIEAGEASYTWIKHVPDKAAVTPEPPSSTIQQLLDLIPEQPGFKFTGLPENPELRPENLFTWSIAAPDQLASRHSSLTYPNDQYPEDQSLSVSNDKGELVQYPYYEDEQGRRYFFSAHLWYMQREHILRRTPQIASTDPLGAARLLYRFAEIYEGYTPTNDYLWHNYPFSSVSGPPYPRWGGVWLRWTVAELSNLKYLTDTYAMLKETDALEVLSQELGVDVEDKIVNDMFKPSVDFVRSFPATNHNYDNWIGMIELGRILDEPEYVHEGLEFLENYVAEHFMFDGFYTQQTISYHNQYIAGIQEAIEALEGWSDPEGYVSPRLGVTLKDLDMGEHFSALGKAEEIPRILIYPNGKYLPIQDTWANERSTNPKYDAGSYLLPASGIGRLASGAEGMDESALFLTFHGKYGGHYHYDPLNLTLFAEGRELIPDIGYTHTIYNMWAMSTLGHNTVVVDSSDMNMSDEAREGGNIELFMPVDQGLQVMRASQQSAYPQTSEYSREPWFIGFEGAEGAEGYVLDLFRVSGGERHEYTLQGDANTDAFFNANLSLTEYGPYLLPPGTEVSEPETNTDKGDADGHYYGYIYVRNVDKATIDGDNYEVTLVTEEDGEQTPRMRIIGVPDEGNSELFLGESPSVRATRLHGRSMDTNIEAGKYSMPKLVVRRDGTNLESNFVHVLEPYAEGKTGLIDQVERLDVSQAQAGDIAVAVSYGNTTDIILSSNRVDGRPMRVGDISLKGTLGFIRLVDGQVTRMELIDGELLKKGNVTVNRATKENGFVERVLRQSAGDAYNGFVTSEPVSLEAAGRHVIVTRSDGKTYGYRIEAIQTLNGETVIDLGDMDPGFIQRVDGSGFESLFHPFDHWEGQTEYTIHHSASR